MNPLKQYPWFHRLMKNSFRGSSSERENPDDSDERGDNMSDCSGVDVAYDTLEQTLADLDVDIAELQEQRTE